MSLVQGPPDALEPDNRPTMQQAVSGVPDDLVVRTPDIEPGSYDPASGGDQIGEVF